AVEHDQSANLQLLWEKARQTGATRVGVVLCKNLKSFDYIHNLGAAGFQQELDASVAPIPKFVYCPDSKRQQTISDLNDWIAAYSPQVVIGDSDSVCEMLMQTGAAVPEDISFLSLRSGIGHRPSLPSHMHTSGISLCIREAGQVAANLLSMQIQNNNRGLPAVRITHLIQTNYLTGHTLRPQVR
ncbi:MAG: substrate-binding domain-containing protein, partial [Verrucomicrobiota bacterium]